MCSVRSMSDARPVVRGASYALTRRTNFRKAFLAPWHPGVDQAWLYALGHAQQQTGVSLHCATKVINHHHLDLTDNEEKRPEFLRLFHGELSCALNTLLGRERYDQPGQIFDDRATHHMRLLDAEAQAAHLVYESVQCVAAGLVRRPEDMPGFVFDFSLWKGLPIRVRRPEFYFDPRLRDEYVNVWFNPPARLYRKFNGDLDQLIYYMRRLQREAIRALNAARKWPVMGVQRTKRIHPYSEPRTRRTAGGEVVPSYKQGASGINGRRVHIQAKTEVTTFRRTHRAGVKALRAGDPIPFPYGTYKMRKLFPIDVEPADPALLITGPEPTLDEVKAELRLNPVTADDEQVARVLAEVGTAFRDEAAAVVRAEAMEFVSEPPRVPAELLETSDRPEAVVRHRFDKNQPSEARRVVVMRDARRGRPRASGDATEPAGRPPRTSDPPQ